MPGFNEASWYSFFIGVALKSAAVFVMAWLLTWLLCRRSAAARHLVWTAASAAVLALPLLSISLPILRVPSPVSPASASILFRATATVSPDPGASQSPARAGAIVPVKSSRRWPDWRSWLMLFWAAGALVVFARMLIGSAVIWRVRRSAKPFPDRHLCAALPRILGIRHPVNVLAGSIGSMPMTFGFLRSAILLPADAAGWAEERRCAVLLHELAHVRRGDVATHWLARTALAFYWWNPLAWMVWREFLKEREQAADDLVLNAGTRASEYASHLLEVARTLQSSRLLGCAAVAMARRSHLETRLVAILDSRLDRKPPGRAWASLAALLTIATIAPLAAMRAQNTQTTADLDAVIRAANAQRNPDVLEQAAKQAEDARQYDQAQALLRSAAAIRAEVSGEHSVEYGLELLKIGDLEQKRQDHTSLEQRREDQASADYFYTQAAQALGDRPEAAPALTHLGTAALVKGDTGQAIDYLQHAQRVNPAHAGPALMWMALVRQKEKKLDQVEPLFKAALESQDPTAIDTAVTMQLYAAFLRRQGRVDEAKELEARATAIRKRQTATIQAAAGVYKIGPGITAPKVLQKVNPKYGREAKAAGFQGTVAVYAEIGADGAARNLRVLTPLGLGLDQIAMDAIRQWRFEPGTKDGQPVPVSATIEVNFRLL